MIKVFISYSTKDQKFVSQLTSKLESDNIQVWTWDKKMTVGDSINDKIIDALNNTDFYIVVLSKNSVNSQAVNFELSATIINEVSRERNLILPILIEDCEIPFSLKDRLYLDFRVSFDQSYINLIKVIKAPSTKAYHEPDRKSIKFQSNSYKYQLKKLQESYTSGNLTLFCGAGISYDAGIPTWDTLLKSLLKEVYSENKEIPDIDIRLANLFQKK
jgi:TIR domain